MSDKRTGLVVLSDAVKAIRIDVENFKTSTVPQAVLDDISSLQSSISSILGNNTTVPQAVLDDISTLQANVSTLQGQKVDVPQAVLDDISTIQANVTALQSASGILSFASIFDSASAAEDIETAVKAGKICPFIAASDSFSYNLGLAASGIDDMKTVRLLNANNPTTEPRSLVFTDAGNTELVVLGAGESCRLIFSQVLGRWVKVDGV